ncbi:VPA1262 family N-terminal domain-containing protein [Burkholderia ubonensis]|uniref:VPA1262 family N-terminal domain-containing protein n=1 Tax=Burkholderia ubonensis TaxID=101571 RepID=UPI0009B38A8A|nr:VPA1262 family N-terminal domain-containing protein [Burkholderia ubonensis]
MTWGIAELIAHLGKLLTPNVIGTYQSFEVTEIIGFYGGGTATNFLSLLAAEPGLPTGIPPNPFLNEKPFQLPGTKWKFGVSRFRIDPEHLRQALEHLKATGVWKLTSTALKVGKLTAIPPQFVPPDAYEPHPWNGVLKNNFFEGSHVLELFDTEKSDHRFLLVEPKKLGELATLVRQYAPLGIDGLSDRIGNLLIQFPVTVTATKFGRHNGNIFAFEPTWRPGTPARPLRVSWENYDDATIENYASTGIEIGAANLPVHLKRSGARYVVWDEQNSVILGATAENVFFGGQVSITSHTINPKTREFLKPPIEGGPLEPCNLVLNDEAPTPARSASANTKETWRAERIFRDSLHSIHTRKEFVQYKGPAGAGRSKALEDIQWLMRAHGRNGVWLWDPYLSARDVLSTLFLCVWPDSDLRGLSDGKAPPPCKHCGKRPDERLSKASHECSGERGDAERKPWELEQRDILEQSKGNCEGLKLEFRVRDGGAGWPFHDRFIIFPAAPVNAMAWSLGTSVNSLGYQHHILQKVPDGALIREAFLELWNLLDGPQFLVWKTP